MTTKLYEPKPGAVGATLEFDLDGRATAGIVWSVAPRANERWVTSNGAYVLVKIDKKRGNYAIRAFDRARWNATRPR